MLDLIPSGNGIDRPKDEYFLIGNRERFPIRKIEGVSIRAYQADV